MEENTVQPQSTKSSGKIARNASYYQRNKDRLQAKSRASYYTHHERNLAKKKEYYEKHRDTVKAKNRSRYQNMKSRIEELEAKIQNSWIRVFGKMFQNKIEIEITYFF